MGAWVNPAAREATLRRSGLLRRHFHVRPSPKCFYRVGVRALPAAPHACLWCQALGQLPHIAFFHMPLHGYGLQHA